MHRLLLSIRTEIRGAWRYRWAAMIASWLVCLLGWMFVYTLPNLYEARAQVYVDADSRLASVVKRVGVEPGVSSRVFVVRQAMLGRPQLERVARETDLDLRARTEEEKDALLFMLSEKVSVRSGRANEARNLYTISYEDRDRSMAIAVVQELLNTFVEDVLNLKVQGADEVSGYLEDQLEYYANLLSESELRLANFKKEYVGLLPGESGGIFERLQMEMDLLKQEQLDLQIEVDRQAELRRQLSGESAYIAEGAGSAPGVGVPGSATEAAITELELRRSQLLLGFTERHPDVVAIDEQLAQLYAKRDTERAALAASQDGIEGVGNATNPVYQSVQIALNEASVRIAEYRSRVAQRQAAVRRLNEQINTIPQVEAEYAELTRDYAQYSSLYTELLLQRERERMGTVSENSDIVSFNVIDPPSASLEPVAPKRPILLTAVFFVGLGIGGALAFVLHAMRPVFHHARSLREICRRPVLGVVSITNLELHGRHRLMDITSFTASVIALAFLFVLSLAFQDSGAQLAQQIISQASG